MTTKNFDRADEMQELRFVAKWTLQRIADKFNISRERVRQIIGNTGKGFLGTHKREVAAQNQKLSNSKLANLLGIKSVAHYRNGERHEIDGGYVKLGADAEESVSKELSKRGIKHELMPHHHAFDILLENGLRVDVKSSAPSNHFDFINPFYSFSLAQDRRGHYADYFICVLRDTNDMFVIPASATKRNTNTPIRFCFPESDYGKKSKWLQYHNRFDLLKEAVATK